MSDPSRPPCTSASNCLVVDEISGGAEVMLRSTRHPDRPGILDTDEWEAHLADVRAEALTEAAAILRRDPAYHVLSFTDFGAGIRHAVTTLTKLAATPSATEPADDAPPVPEQAPEPQGPAQTPEGFGFLDHPLTLRLGQWGCRCGWTTSTDGREAMVDHAVHVHVAVGLAVEDDEPQGPAEGSAGVRCTCAHCWSAPDSHWYRSTCKLCPAECDCGCGGPEPVPEVDASLDRLTAERDAARAGRDALGGQLVAAHLEHQQALDQLDTARAAAEGFRDELNRTGEMLLAMTADRDRLAAMLKSEGYTL